MTNTKELFPIPESRRSDRFFLAGIDGRQTLFVLHADHSISIAPVNSEAALIEPAEPLLAELSGLAA